VDHSEQAKLAQFLDKWNSSWICLLWDEKCISHNKGSNLDPVSVNSSAGVKLTPYGGVEFFRSLQICTTCKGLTRFNDALLHDLNPVRDAHLSKRDIRNHNTPQMPQSRCLGLGSYPWIGSIVWRVQNIAMPPCSCGVSSLTHLAWVAMIENSRSRPWVVRRCASGCCKCFRIEASEVLPWGSPYTEVSWSAIERFRLKDINWHSVPCDTHLETFETCEAVVWSRRSMSRIEAQSKSRP
jgi:hypothetical protein